MGQWPVVRQDTVRIVRYEDFMKDEPYNPQDYNFLNMDVQGMELAALKGMGDQLDYFDVLVIECSDAPVYQGEAPASEIIEWLNARGFDQMTPTKLHNDILFVRRNK